MCAFSLPTTSKDEVVPDHNADNFHNYHLENICSCSTVG